MPLIYLQCMYLYIYMLYVWIFTIYYIYVYVYVRSVFVCRCPKVPATYARWTFRYYLNEPILHSCLHQARVHEDDAWVHKTIKFLEFKKFKKCRRPRYHLMIHLGSPRKEEGKMHDIIRSHPKMIE